MKEIISVINQKGGVGKSTTSHLIGCGLTERGFKVLFIDLDSQGNLSYTVGVDRKGPSSLGVLTQETNVKEAIKQTQYGDIIQSSSALAGADAVITALGKEYRLKEALETIKEDYDYIVIDTPPALGILTINALTASDSIVIPTQADIYSLQGIAQLRETVHVVRQYCNKDLKIKGILLTRYNNRSVLSREMADLLLQTASKLGTKLFKTCIRENITIREAQLSQKSVFEYAPKSNAAQDYNSFLDEILKGE